MSPLEQDTLCPWRQFGANASHYADIRNNFKKVFLMRHSGKLVVIGPDSCHRVPEADSLLAPAAWAVAATASLSRGACSSRGLESAAAARLAIAIISSGISKEPNRETK